MRTDLEVLADEIRRARRITAITGAGVSAASGVPTFRGEGGLWRTYRAEDLATPDAFRRNPTLVWEWYDWRRSLIASCNPNAAHDVLARWSQRDGFTLITQNVDGLHERAGAKALRLHGSIWELRCADACGLAPWEDRQTPLPTLPPRCASCGALARPGVVWFGEALDADVLRRAAAATACDVFLSIGTSSIVYPAAGLVYDARRHGAFTAEINPVATEAAAVVDLLVEMPGEDALPRIEALADLPPEGGSHRF
jgi:NAD-dependent protein deacetylase/lipoamidase